MRNMYQFMEPFVHLSVCLYLKLNVVSLSTFLKLNKLRVHITYKYNSNGATGYKVYFRWGGGGVLMMGVWLGSPASSLVTRGFITKQHIPRVRVRSERGWLQRHTLLTCLPKFHVRYLCYYQVDGEN